MHRAFAGLQPSGGKGCNPHLGDCAWTGEAKVTPETTASTIINSNFLDTAYLPCAVGVQPGAARDDPRARPSDHIGPNTPRCPTPDLPLRSKRPPQGYFSVSAGRALGRPRAVTWRHIVRRAARMAEWFKALVLKFALLRCVQFHPVSVGEHFRGFPHRGRCGQC